MPVPLEFHGNLKRTTSYLLLTIVHIWEDYLKTFVLDIEQRIFFIEKYVGCLKYGSMNQEKSHPKG